MIKFIKWFFIIFIIFFIIGLLTSKKNDVSNDIQNRYDNATSSQKSCVKTLGEGVYSSKPLEGINLACSLISIFSFKPSIVSSVNNNMNLNTVLFPTFFS